MNVIKVGKRITFPKKFIKGIKSELGTETLRVTIKNYLNLLSFDFGIDGDFTVEKHGVNVSRFITKYFSDAKFGFNCGLMEYQPYQRLSLDSNIIILALTGTIPQQVDLSLFGSISYKRQVPAKRSSNEVLIRPDGRICLPRNVSYNKCWVEGDQDRLIISFKENPNALRRKGHAVDCNKMVHLGFFFHRISAFPSKTFARSFNMDNEQIVIYLKGSLDYFLTK